VDETYTNDLHEALLQENCPNFWKIWHSKFNINTKCDHGCANNSFVAHSFMKHFSTACANKNGTFSLALKYEFLKLKDAGLPLTDEHLF